MFGLIKHLVCILLVLQFALGDLLFPEYQAVDKKKSNLAGRTPLYAPSRCKQHELLYPGDQVNDWICDCAPAALYHPETDACYPAFRRGPCEDGEFLVLGDNAVLPVCIANDCKVDGQIKIKGVCYEFGKAGACKDSHLSYVIGVNPQTLHVDCVKLSISLESRFGEEPQHSYDLTNVDLCARGCKRAIQGRCPGRK
ncbi:uncharacterized protein LOC119610438 [Lucilia sericata]|uniref:uncharacterized protein LOC119610438 n=1 Tax=Lucilia sericata TaxID=13632 RepID=UPI0018A849ED|nr:uncharacterized protein LOC119610438 [Lucilia sericata]